MFQHFHAIIREFTTNVFLSYVLFYKLQQLKIHFIKLNYFTSTEQGIGFKLPDDDTKMSKLVGV
jgi:hypothetical protein